MRLHRERRRQGLRCLMIELRETEIDVLVGRGLLNSETRHDPRAVTEALYAHLGTWSPSTAAPARAGTTVSLCESRAGGATAGFLL
jgi:hypothetical protein